MRITFERLTPTIGAEMIGLDARQKPTASDARTLLEGLGTHGVLIARDQDLDDAALVDFARAFGELELLPEPEKREKAHPAIFNLSNVGADDRPVDFDDPQAVFLRGTERWHTDSSYREIPCLASMLHAIEVPGTGGRTEFASMSDAYDALPPARRRAVDGLRAVHSYESSRANNPGDMAPMSEAERRRVPPVEHPVVRTLAGGRRSIYLGAHASHVAGMPVEEGRALLRALETEAIDLAGIYSHEWRVSDLVIWDNRSTLHRLRPYDIARVRRVMRRVTVAGTGPVV